MNNNLFTYSFSLLNIDYVQLNKRWNYNNVVSPYYRMYYIDAGEGAISSATETLAMVQGYLYLIPSFTVCNLKCTDFLSQYFVQFFEESPDGISLFKNNRNIMKIKASELDISIFQNLLKINPGRGINRSDNPEIYEKEAYYKEYRDLNRTIKTSVKFESQGIILMLLSRFIKTLSFKSNNSEKISSIVLDAINFIQLNLENTISVSDLAENANQNRDYFSRKFLEHTGQRPLEYIHEKRIERAQYLLVTTNKTLLAIAIETGFNNSPHFSKIFKNKVKITPGEYRKQSLRIT